MIPVVGLDVLWRPLNAACVHRPEIVAELAGSPLGAPVTPAMVAAVVGHPHGGGKNVPPGARVVPWLNKADTLAQPRAARELTELLVQTPWIERAVIGAAARPEPLWHLVPRPSQPVR